jgi:hypothetical protein
MIYSSIADLAKVCVGRHADASLLASLRAGIEPVTGPAKSG